MAEIRPFAGLRYTENAGPIADLVAPPYDVISPEEREILAAKSPHNIVSLTLPLQNEDDRSKFVKYARSGADLAEWRRVGLLKAESESSFYRYSQTFKIPGSSAAFLRTALIGLIKVEPYEKGVVLPHELTFPKHKEDRLRILEATRAHLECIFGLFEDDGGTVFSDISRACAVPVAKVTTDDGVAHVLEAIQDRAEIEMLAKNLASRKVWIADGHHRYETALAFRQSLGQRDRPVAEDYMMMALGSMSDPGLVLLPTHRIVRKMPISPERLDDAMQLLFNVRKIPNGNLLEELEGLRADDTRAFGVALPGGQGLLLTLDRPQECLSWIAGEASDRLKLLDVTILHQVIFDRMLGLRGLDFFDYTRDPDEALRAVETGCDAAFLMNPPSVDDMREIALGGEKMPQKSTYYYPKILSGLVLWSLNDFSQ